MEKYRYYVDLPGDLWEDGTFMDLIRMNAAPLVWAMAAEIVLAMIIAFGCRPSKRTCSTSDCPSKRGLMSSCNDMCNER